MFPPTWITPILNAKKTNCTNRDQRFYLATFLEKVFASNFYNQLKKDFTPLTLSFEEITKIFKEQLTHYKNQRPLLYTPIRFHEELRVVLDLLTVEVNKKLEVYENELITLFATVPIRPIRKQRVYSFTVEESDKMKKAKVILTNYQVKPTLIYQTGQEVIVGHKTPLAVELVKELETINVKCVIVEMST
jgi:hypothetical protein